MMRACSLSAVCCAVALLSVAACDRPDADAAGERPADSRETTARPSADWPAAGAAVELRRERRIDLTGDGDEEVVAVTARGARYDSLAIALTVIGAQHDTLWLERWPSLLYFKYQPREELDDSAVARIVRNHVDSLLADDRFTTGPPPRLSQGTGALDMMREAVRYHLAELDWRGMADLTPADELPPEAHSRIDAQRVAPERVTVVIDELRSQPSFWYFAGGEATYAIAWSEREHAFVRIFACC